MPHGGVMPNFSVCASTSAMYSVMALLPQSNAGFRSGLYMDGSPQGKQSK